MVLACLGTIAGAPLPSPVEYSIGCITEATGVGLDVILRRHRVSPLRACRRCGIIVGEPGPILHTRVYVCERAAAPLCSSTRVE